MRNSVFAVAAVAVMLGGCSSRPREFAPTLTAAANQAEFDAAYSQCQQLLLAGKLDSSGRILSAGAGVAAGTATAAAGGTAAAAIGGYAGLAAVSATIVLLPFAILGGAWGMSRMKRAKKEAAIKAAMEGCLAERGYQVAGWTKAIKKPPAESLGPGLPPVAAAPAFLVEPIAEKVIDGLPPAPLYWRVERFPTLAEAQAAAGQFSLAAESWGQAWLFTLGGHDGVSSGGQKLAEIGPVPAPAATKYLLRINRAGGPPGARTPIHMHPGSEAFYVLKGELTQHTGHGDAPVAAGKSMNGHAPGMAMQLESSGTEPLQQLVLFVVDADKPFSSPAEFGQ